ncbi:MAG: hypothetical protein ACREPW_10175, partial [Candidatus Binataceae bacterium]
MENTLIPVALAVRLHAMPGPLLSEVLPDLVEEMASLLRERGAEPLCDQLRALRIESVCDCGDEN